MTDTRRFIADSNVPKRAMYGFLNQNVKEIFMVELPYLFDKEHIHQHLTSLPRDCTGQQWWAAAGSEPWPGTLNRHCRDQLCRSLLLMMRGAGQIGSIQGGMSCQSIPACWTWCRSEIVLDLFQNEKLPKLCTNGKLVAHWPAKFPQLQHNECVCFWSLITLNSHSLILPNSS